MKHPQHPALTALIAFATFTVLGGLFLSALFAAI